MRATETGPDRRWVQRFVRPFGGNSCCTAFPCPSIRPNHAAGIPSSRRNKKSLLRHSAPRYVGPGSNRAQQPFQASASLKMTSPSCGALTRKAVPSAIKGGSLPRRKTLSRENRYFFSGEIDSTRGASSRSSFNGGSGGASTILIKSLREMRSSAPQIPEAAIVSSSFTFSGRSRFRLPMTRQSTLHYFL